MSTVRAELLSGYPNPLDGALVAVMGRREGKVRLGVTRDGRDEPVVSLGEGDVLTLTRGWRVVQVMPRRPASSNVPGSGSGQVAAVLETVD